MSENDTRELVSDNNEKNKIVVRNYKKGLLLALKKDWPILIAIALLLCIIRVIVFGEAYIFNYKYPEIVYPEVSNVEMASLSGGAKVTQYFTPHTQHITSIAYYLVAVPEEYSDDAALNMTLYDGDNKVIVTRSMTFSSINNGDWTIEYFRNGFLKLPLRVSDSKEYHIVFSVTGCDDGACPYLILTDDTESLSGIGECIVGDSVKDGMTLYMGYGYPDVLSKYVIFFTVVILLCTIIYCIYLYYRESKSKEENANSENRISYYIPKIKVIIAIVIPLLWFILALPDVVYKIDSVSLDPSWRWALNVAYDKGYVFGENFFFSYGPLGFVYYLINMGDSATYKMGLLIWGCLFAVSAYLFARIFVAWKKGHISTTSLVFAFLVYVLTFHESWTDNYLQFMVVMALVLWDIGDRTAIIPLNILITFSFFGKIIGFVSGLTMVFVYALFRIAFDNRLSIKKRLKLLWLPVPSLIAMLVLQIIYSGSISGFIGYFTNIFRNVSGFNMTQQFDDSYSEVDFLCFYIILAVYLILFAIFVIKDRRRAAIFLASGVPLFSAYKYGVTAHGMECSAWVAVMPISALMLDMPLGLRNLVVESPDGELRGERPKVLYKPQIQAVICVGCTIIAVLFAWCGHGSLSHISNDMHNKIYTLTHLSEDSRESSLYESGQLPQNILDIVGDSTVGIYPWRLAYGAVYEDLDIRFSPTVFDGAEIYNDSLDAISAQYYREKGPEYIIMSCEVVYGQVNLLNDPQIWYAIKDNYNAVYTDDEFCVLKRKETPDKEKTYTLIETDTYKTGDRIECPEGADFAVIDLKYSFSGKLRGLFWRYGVTYINIEYSDGQSMYGTALVPQISAGFGLTYYPQDTYGVEKSLNDSDVPVITAFTLSGEGLKSMEDTVTVKWYSED